MKVYLTNSELSEPGIGPLETPIVIGRVDGATIQLQDRWVSRLHCEVNDRNGEVLVRDLGSSHGTYVNGSRVDQSPLSPGDEIVVGLTTLTVYWDIMMDRGRTAPADAHEGIKAQSL